MLKIKVESIVTPTQAVRNRQDRKAKETESLPCYSIGKRYPNFNMLESFIEDYNTDIRNLSEGDIIIRDWQYGHIDNTGYRPYRIIKEFDGASVTVTDDRNTYNICADPIITKNTYWHKLNKDFCID